MCKKICLVIECINDAKALGLCPKHYKKKKKYGDPLFSKIELHGMSKYPEYLVWKGMKSRCYNPNMDFYMNYGGRGISVCYRWVNSFSNFYEDMGPRPTPKHQIDRIDNDSNYEPGNCRWVTPVENNRKRDFSRLDLKKANEIRILYKTGTKSQQDLANIYKVTKTNIRNIIHNKIWKEV